MFSKKIIFSSMIAIVGILYNCTPIHTYLRGVKQVYYAFLPKNIEYDTYDD